MTSGAMGDLSGKVAVVTGGSNGIGAATVRMLAEAGAQVVVGYNKGKDRAEALIAELPGERHSIQQITLEDGASVKRAAKEIGDRYGAVHVLVNSAGFTKPVPHANIAALDDDFIDSMLIANVRGPLSMIRELTPAMKASGDAVVINVSSVSGFTASGSSVVYCAAKAAIDNISMSLGRALGPEIRVLTVSPAAVATDFVAGRGREQLEAQAEKLPLKRVTEPEDVARTILACVTHLKLSTGTRIVCDGGRYLV